MLKEIVYNNAPIFFQNIMTSTYGCQLHWERYGGRNTEYTNQLKQSEFQSKALLQELQTRELRKLVSHAYHTTEYYRELLDEVGLKPSDLTTIDDLKSVPILTKNQIRKRHQAFLSRSFTIRGLSKIYTSGTTGSPLTVFYDLNSRRKNYAFFNRVRSWQSIKSREKRATFYGRVIVPPKQKGPPFWRYDIAENNYLFSSYHMSPINLPYYCDELRRLQPVEIRGYPSSLYTLAQYMLDHKRSDIFPKAIFTTAETLLEHVREIIEKAFMCKVTDTYGCTEMGFYISQCEYGTYHAHPEYGIVEAVSSQGAATDIGGGDLVCTGFINYAMPLIRYKIGDVIAIDEEECRCGRHFPIITSILGRTDDIIVTPDGKRVGRLDPIFKGTLGVKEAQIIQTQQNEIVMKVVKKEDYSSKDMEFLSDELHKRVGASMRIKFEFVSEIEKDPNGKFRSVVSLVNRNGANGTQN